MRRPVIYGLWLLAVPAWAGLKMAVGGCLIPLVPIAAALLVAAALTLVGLRTGTAEARG